MVPDRGGRRRLAIPAPDDILSAVSVHNYLGRTLVTGGNRPSCIWRRDRVHPTTIHAFRLLQHQAGAVSNRKSKWRALRTANELVQEGAARSPSSTRPQRFLYGVRWGYLSPSQVDEDLGAIGGSAARWSVLV